MVTEAFEMCFEFHCEFRDLLELKILGWIEVVGDVISLIKLRGARMHLMQLDTGEICEPRQRGFFGRDDVILLFFAKNYMLDPGRRPLRPILLVKRLAANAVRVTDQRE